MVSTPRGGIHDRLTPLPGSASTLSRSLRLHFCRFRHGHLLHAGDCGHRRVHLAIPRASQTIWTRRIIFVRFVSYSPAVRHMAGTPHPRGTGLDVSFDLYPDPCPAKRVGNAPGKSDQHAREQAYLRKKTSAHLDFSSKKVKLVIPGEKQFRLDFFYELVWKPPQFDRYRGLLLLWFLQIAKLTLQ